MYSQKVINRFTNPKFSGEIKNPDAVGEEGNLRCGDIMRIFIKVNN
ncbi:MAG: iron-sulfur cluster assembly scaffold protein, partial [Nanoarchaeota archaeon]|nr:iron-sulfur cluster assembly scaffold protein [Nanoarchaeota archaeon]MBU2640166.1 iron-sulfur cluster assembly scaffold protein [Nanoarchaeota archaeon]